MIFYMGVEGLGGLEMENDEDDTVRDQCLNPTVAHGTTGLGRPSSVFWIFGRPG